MYRIASLGYVAKSVRLFAVPLPRTAGPAGAAGQAGRPSYLEDTVLRAGRQVKILGMTIPYRERIKPGSLVARRLQILDLVAHDSARSLIGTRRESVRGR